MTPEQYMEQVKLLSEYALSTQLIVLLIIAVGMAVFGGGLAIFSNISAIRWLAGMCSLFLITLFAVSSLQEYRDYQRTFYTEVTALRQAYIAEAPH